MPMSRLDHDYSSQMQCLNIQTLENRRVVADLFFLFKVIHGYTSIALTSLVNFNAPARSVRAPIIPFRPSFFSSRFSLTDPIGRICTSANNYSDSFDILRRASMWSGQRCLEFWVRRFKISYAVMYFVFFIL